VILGFGFLTEGCNFKSAPAKVSNGLVLTPPMGWNSWNTFMSGVSDALLRQTADAMVMNGMRDAGYQYINIDDGWAMPERKNGHLCPDPEKFPKGFKPVSDYLHAKGFKFGIYSDRGTHTCVKKSPGSFGHETTDANDFAAWGVDYLKYDNCNPAVFSTQESDYRRMRDALAATGRPFVFSICAWKYKKWMPELGNLWRTTDDIRDNWESIMDIIDINEKLAEYAGPGKWNDPDMLVVGCNGTLDVQFGQSFDVPEMADKRGMTDLEYQTHFGMWAIMAAPLIAGNDLRNMPRPIQEILLNKEVIAVDQDPLGRQGVKIWDDGKGLNVYAKELKAVNTRAVILLNRTKGNEKMTVKWSDAGIPPGPAIVRDLWRHRDMGTFMDSYNAYVPSHGTAFLRIVSENTR
jgi:alpha-galactosidase